MGHPESPFCPSELGDNLRITEGFNIMVIMRRAHLGPEGDA